MANIPKAKASRSLEPAFRAGGLCHRRRPESRSTTSACGTWPDAEPDNTSADNRAIRSEHPEGCTTAIGPHQPRTYECQDSAAGKKPRGSRITPPPQPEYTHSGHRETYELP